MQKRVKVTVVIGKYESIVAYMNLEGDPDIVALVEKGQYFPTHEELKFYMSIEPSKKLEMLEQLNSYIKYSMPKDLREKYEYMRQKDY